MSDKNMLCDILEQILNHEGYLMMGSQETAQTDWPTLSF